MSFHNKPKYQIPELIQSLKDHGLEHDKPSQLADSFRTGWIAGRAAVQAAQPEAVGWKSMPTVEELADRIASMLHGTYHCNRVWNAWNVGTMSQDDFEPLDESETPTEIAAEIHAMLASAPTEPMSAPTAEPVAWAIIASNTGRMCQATLNKYEIEGHNPAHIVPLYATPPSAAAQPEAVGWKLVPVEPDETMQAVGDMNLSCGAADVYCAMLAAAPTPTESQPAEADERSERDAETVELLDELEDARLMADTHHTSVGAALGKAIDWIQARALSAPTAPAQAEPRKPDDVDLLLRAVFELCEATEEAPEVAPRNEHQRGFDKGRRFEAKGIRRAVGDWFQATFCGQSFMGEPVLTKPGVAHCIDGACHLCATPPSAATPEPSDAERLDWLETADWAMVQDQLQLWFDLPTCWKPATVRAAIDAAIRATKGGKL